ncbi:MAG TPA: MEDS domain-containing protein, partial [Nitrospira sp.]
MSYAEAKVSLTTDCTHPMISPFHSVQFYEDDGFLIESMASFIRQGLKVNDSVIIVATAGHRDQLRKMLTPAEWVSDRLMFLDADELLSTFMNGEWPDESRFMMRMGSLIRQVGRMGRVRLFGEMVNILCQKGKPRAALRVEELWNKLASYLPFLLLCGYSHSAT